MAHHCGSIDRFFFGYMAVDDSLLAVFRRARSFCSGTSISRITGMLRDVLMAAAFGATSSVAAFMVAFRLAHLLRRVLGEGALQAAFIPQFEEERQQSVEQGKELFRNLYCCLLGLLTVLIVVGELVLVSLYTAQVLSLDNQEVLLLLLWTLPGLFFVCLYGLQSSLLQCEGSYFLPSVAPVAFNLVWIAAVVLLWQWDTTQAMPWLAAAVSIGCFVQWLVTLPATLQIVSLKHLFSSLNLRSPALRRFTNALFIGLIGISASQMNAALDVVFARYADAEGPAFLWYAIRLQQLPLALFGVALSGALLPSVARAVKSGETTQAMRLVLQGLRWVGWVMTPMTVGIFFFGGFAVRLLYAHGDFTLEAAAYTTRCLWAYGLGLLPMTSILILAPMLYSARLYHVTARGSLLSVGVNCGLNSLFILGWGWGPASVALATSLSAWLNAAYLWYHVRAWNNTLILK